MSGDAFLCLVGFGLLLVALTARGIQLLGRWHRRRVQARRRQLEAEGRFKPSVSLGTPLDGFERSGTPETAQRRSKPSETLKQPQKGFKPSEKLGTSLDGFEPSETPETPQEGFKPSEKLGARFGRFKPSETLETDNDGFKRSEPLETPLDGFKPSEKLGARFGRFKPSETLETDFDGFKPTERLKPLLRWFKRLGPLETLLSRFKLSVSLETPLDGFKPSEKLGAAQEGFKPSETLETGDDGFKRPETLKSAQRGFKPSVSLGRDFDGFKPSQSLKPTQDGFKPSETLEPSLDGFKPAEPLGAGREGFKPPESLPPLEAALRCLPQRVALDQLQPFPMARTAVPLGVDYNARPVWADFADDLLHCGIYGTSRCGKDNLLRVWFSLLCKRNTPEEVQFAFIDGKGDWLTPDLAELAHMFIPPAGGYGEKGKQAILIACKRIDTEAERRQQLIFGSGCRTREEYNRRYPNNKLPLLVVVASDVMDSVAGEVEALLASLVSKAAALGMRVVASMQTPTGKGMDWRMNLSSVLAGALVDGSQDGPALGVREVKGLPFRPSRIPPPPRVRGVFVARVRGQFTLVRTPLFSLNLERNEDRFNEIVASLPKTDGAVLAELLSSVSPANLDDDGSEVRFAVRDGSGGSEAVQPEPNRDEPGWEDAYPVNRTEAIQLRNALQFYDDGYNETDAICSAFEVTKGGSSRYVRARALFKTALAVRQS